MATSDVKIVQENATTDFELKTISPVANSVLAFDGSKVPIAKVLTVSDVPQAVITGISLASGSWSLVSGLYEYTYSNASILSSSIVSVIPDNSTIDIVTAAQVLPYVLVSSGSIKIYAKNAPSNTISINIIIGA